jgi:hypothetical protein
MELVEIPIETRPRPWTTIEVWYDPTAEIIYTIYSWYTLVKITGKIPKQEKLHNIILGF